MVSHQIGGETEGNFGQIIVIIIIITIIVIIIIIITRPKPAYGRQGLAGSWGQDTDELRTFLVFLTARIQTNLGPLMTIKIHLES